MPIYVYRCRACGQRFELFRNFGERGAFTNCPDCESNDCVAQVTVPAVAHVEGGTGAQMGDRAS